MTAHVLVDGVWVDMQFPASDLKYSTCWPSEPEAAAGDFKASVTLACPKGYQAPWMRRDAIFRVYTPIGGLVWGGILVEPDRPDGQVTLHAVGIQDSLKDWDAVYDADPTGTLDEQPSFIPNEAVDYAEANGAPFSRYGVDLGDDPIANGEDTPLIKMSTLLTRAATLQGKRVHVDSLGAITFQSESTTPTWTTTPQSDYMGTADDQFVSRLRGYYLKDGSATFAVRLTGVPTGGTFTLSGNGATTAATNHNASAATVQTRVQSLGGVFAAATVSAPVGSTSQWNVQIPANGATLTGTSSLTGGTNPGVSIVMTQGDGLVKYEDGIDKFGVRERSIDLSRLGPISTATAQDYVDGRGALVAGRMGWTEGVDLHRNNLLHISGVWANTARHVRAGDVLQIPGVVDARSNPTTRGAIQFVLSEVEVTEADRPTSFAAPIGFTPRDFEGALAPPENPADKETA